MKGGGIGPGRGARIYAQVAEVFPASTISKDDLRTVYNEVCTPHLSIALLLHVPDCDAVVLMREGWLLSGTHLQQLPMVHQQAPHRGGLPGKGWSQRVSWVLQEKEARAAQAKEGKQSNPPLHADHSRQSSELPSSHLGTPHPASSSAGHSSQPRPGSASVRPASAASQEHPAMQQPPAAAANQLMPLQTTLAQHALQPLPPAAATSAAPQAAAVEGGAPEQRQPSQPPASASRPGSAGAAGLASVPEQQTGMNGGEQHEKGLSQSAGASGSGQSRRSEAEHAERLQQAVEAAASQGADREQLQSLVNSLRRGTAKAIINEVLPKFPHSLSRILGTLLLHEFRCRLAFMSVSMSLTLLSWNL